MRTPWQLSVAAMTVSCVAESWKATNYRILSSTL